MDIVKFTYRADWGGYVSSLPGNRDGEYVRIEEYDELAREMLETESIGADNTGWRSTYGSAGERAADYLIERGQVERHPEKQNWFRWMVKVEIYSHPSWDMELILEANHFSRSQAEDNLSDDADKSLLVCKQARMTVGEFYSLPEFEG